MDYSTFDTDTQHTRLCSENAYIIYVIVQVQMWFVYLNTCWSKPKKIFECFICFWIWFYRFMSFVFDQNVFFFFFFFLCFSSKTGSESVLWETRDLELPAKCAWGKLKSHIFIQRVSLLPCEYFVTKIFSRNVFRQKLEIFQFHIKAITTISWLFCD